MATETTKLTYVEGAAASTPAASRVVTYSKADGLMYSKDDAGVETLMSAGVSGSIATDPIWDAAGDLVQGTGANTAAKLSAGTAGMFLKSAGAAAANLWAFPPGHEIDYAEITSSVNVTAVDGVGTDNIVSGAAVAYDGSTAVWIEFYSSAFITPNIAGGVNYIFIALFDGASQLGTMAINLQPNSVIVRQPVLARRKLTPTAATHTYHIKAAIGGAGTGVVQAGSGASGNPMPAYIRITKA